jgi:hypothetical protein
MDTTVADLSTHELENLIGNVIDRRMQVWLTQLLDAVGEQQEEEPAEMQPEFKASLEQAFQQAESGDVIPLSDFRKQLFGE